MFLSKILKRYRTVHPKSLRETIPIELAEVRKVNSKKGIYNYPIILENLDEVAKISSDLSFTGRQLWNSTKLIRENRYIRKTHNVCVVGGSLAIQRVWREYKIQPNVVYVPDTEKEIPSWCLKEELPSCIIRCPPVEINKHLLSAEYGDGYAAEFPIPNSLPILEHFLGENKIKRFSSMLVLIGLRIPSNVGILIRAAVDMGYESIILEDCVDLFNEKVIRSSEGTIFSSKIKIFETSGTGISILSNIALDHQLFPILAVPSQKAESAFLVAKRLHTINAKLKLKNKEHEKEEKEIIINNNNLKNNKNFINHYGPLLILGSESQGLKSLEGEWSVPSKVVSIPLPNSSIDSINVSVAGSILLHNFRPAAEEHFLELLKINEEDKDDEEEMEELLSQGQLALTTGMGVSEETP